MFELTIVVFTIARFSVAPCTTLTVRKIVTVVAYFKALLQILSTEAKKNHAEPDKYSKHGCNENETGVLIALPGGGSASVNDQSYETR
jgi:hypothetical protein